MHLNKLYVYSVYVFTEPHGSTDIAELSPNFQTFKEPKNRFQGTNAARLCSLAGRYDNPVPTLFLAPHRLFKNSSSGQV
jgi:hypothetical protein